MNKYLIAAAVVGCGLSVSCASETSASMPMEKDVVATLAALTLEAFQPNSVLTAAALSIEQDPASGPSVEITPQEGENRDFEDGETKTELPDSYYIRDIWGHRQYFGIGCEASAVVDWADYFGVTVSEFNFQLRLPLSDNPDLGFVGSVNGPWGQVPPYAYGVHAAPVAVILQEYYGMDAVGVKAFTIEGIKREIASGQPVIAWVIGNCVGGIPFEYIDESGTPVTVAAYEHVVILTGYNEETIRYMNNGKFYDIPFANFENTWSVLGNMIVYLAD